MGDDKATLAYARKAVEILPNDKEIKRLIMDWEDKICFFWKTVTLNQSISRVVRIKRFCLTFYFL